MTSGKYIRNLIWEEGIKTLDARYLAVGLSCPLAELPATTKDTFKNIVRIINKLPQVHVIVLEDSETLLKVPCWDGGQHSFTKVPHGILGPQGQRKL